MSTLSTRKIVDDDDDDDDEDDKHGKKPKTPSKHDDDDDDDEDDDNKHGKDTKKPSDSKIRRKNTIISLLCSNDPLAPPMTLSFVASPDSCTYIFEARTNAACGGVETAKQQLGPSGVFGVIVLIAVIVYVVGGCVYQRTVMHQRGWKQLPNYALWAGIAGFASVSISPCQSPRDVEADDVVTGHVHNRDLVLCSLPPQQKGVQQGECVWQRKHWQAGAGLGRREQTHRPVGRGVGFELE